MGATETIEPTAVEVEPQETQGEPKVGAPLKFEYSTWVHVGGGAEDCEAIDEEKGTNDCSNPTHFHAWLRLPNQLQHKDLREEAMAAKARRMRQLRDEDANAYIILEDSLEQVLQAAERSDAGKATLIDELLAKEWFKVYQDAVAEVREMPADDVPDDHEGDPPLKYEHVERDQRRLDEILLLDEDKRPADEVAELEKHITGYYEAIAAKQEELQKPEREALESLEPQKLIEKLREQRIDIEANEAFMHTYNVHEWAACTFRQPSGQRMFSGPDELREQAPEVIDTLKATFNDLEQTAAAGRAEGN